MTGWDSREGLPAGLPSSSTVEVATADESVKDWDNCGTPRKVLTTTCKLGMSTPRVSLAGLDFKTLCQDKGQSSFVRTFCSGHTISASSSPIAGPSGL